MIKNIKAYMDRFGNLEALEGVLPEDAILISVKEPMEKLYEGQKDVSLVPVSVEVASGTDRRRVKLRASNLEQAMGQFESLKAQIESGAVKVGGLQVSITPWINGDRNTIQSSWTFLAPIKAPKDAKPAAMPF